MGLMFAGLGLLPLPEVTALGYTAPLLVVIFAAMFLDEKVGIFRIGAVMLGLAGVLVVLSPRLTALDGPTVDTAQAVGAVLVLLGSTSENWSRPSKRVQLSSTFLLHRLFCPC